MSLQYYRLVLDPPEQLGRTEHRSGDGITLAGGAGWDLRIDISADSRRSETLGRHTLLLQGDSHSGVYVTRKLLEDLDINPQGWSTTRMGAVRLYQITLSLMESIVAQLEQAENGSDVEEYTAKRNAAIFHSLYLLTERYGGGVR